MSNQDSPKQDKNGNNDNKEMRMMWIFSGAVVVLILGMMGANMVFHKDTTTGTTDISSRSRTAPQN